MYIAIKLNDMDNKELRIGNLVFDLEEKENTEVIQWTFESDYFTSLKPIPLTEEWLIKFGFVVAKTRWRKGAVVLSKNDNGYLFKTTAINIKHLHQLQNLYFALTNEELTIK